MVGHTPKHYSSRKMVAKPRAGPLTQENLLPSNKEPTNSEVTHFFESLSLLLILEASLSHQQLLKWINSFLTREGLSHARSYARS